MKKKQAESKQLVKLERVYKHYKNNEFYITLEYCYSQDANGQWEQGVVYRRLNDNNYGAMKFHRTCLEFSQKFFCAFDNPKK